MNVSNLPVYPKFTEAKSIVLKTILVINEFFRMTTPDRNIFADKKHKYPDTALGIMEYICGGNTA